MECGYFLLVVPYTGGVCEDADADAIVDRNCACVFVWAKEGVADDRMRCCV